MEENTEHLPLYGPGPLYVATIIVLTVVGIALSGVGILPVADAGSASGFLKLLVLLPVFWAFLTVLMKATEERWLRDLYGREYEDYCARVNRCIPCFPRR